MSLIKYFNSKSARRNMNVIVENYLIEYFKRTTDVCFKLVTPLDLNMDKYRFFAFEKSSFKNYFFNYIKNKNNLEKTKNEVLDILEIKNYNNFLKVKKYAAFEINNSYNFEMIDSINSFFACLEDKNQVVETKNVIFVNVKKYNVFLNMIKYELLYNENRFFNGSTMLKVGPFFDYVRRYITTIKSYFDYFIQRKYKCRIFAT